MSSRRELVVPWHPPTSDRIATHSQPPGLSSAATLPRCLAAECSHLAGPDYHESKAHMDLRHGHSQPPPQPHPQPQPHRRSASSSRPPLGPLPDLPGAAMTLKNPYPRKAPFLHRNWVDGVKTKQSVMGNAASSLDPKAAAHNVADDDTPPQKRRRISSPMPSTIDHLVPSDNASEVRPTLRFDVVKIFHQDTKKVKSYHTTTVPGRDSTTSANCRITISDVSSGRARVLHCQSQICEIRTSPNPHGPHCIARINLPTPFYVAEDSIRIHRPDDHVFDFSDSYAISVELEPAQGGRWPPLDFLDVGANSQPSSREANRHCTMSCDFAKIDGRQRSPLILADGYFPHQTTRSTQYLVEIDVKSTSGFQTLKRLEKGSQACITAIDPDAPPSATESPDTTSIDDHHEINGVNGVNGVKAINGVHEINGIKGVTDINGVDGITSAAETNGVNGVDGAPDAEATHEAKAVNGFDAHLNDEAHDHEEEVEGNLTPSRSLRTREKNKVYNLKVLSDQALGRDKKRRARDTSAELEGRITYLLPSDQPVCLDYYRCVSCGVYHQSMPQLQAHLLTFHPSYEYLFETTSSGPQFRVSSRNEPFVTPTKAHLLNRGVKPFNLQTYLSRDQAGLGPRHGPPDVVEELPRSPRPKTLLDKLKSASPVPKATTKSAAQAQRRSARPTPTRDDVVVPATNQPLFHPISKAPLKAGEKIPRVAPDTSWLIQKHRDSIDDFSDISAAEKEYIQQWDGFILRQNVTSPAYFPQAWLLFVQEHAAWLTAVNSRMLEFGKHTSYLFVRNVLDDVVFEEAFAYINEARAKRPLKSEDETIEAPAAKPQVSPTKQSPKAPQIYKTSSGCGVCKLPVLGPRLLLCANKACPHRIYHSDCVRVSTKADRQGWLCNQCSDATGTS
jgi:hypothetical protein